MDELRFRSQQSPRNEAPMNSLVSPPRNGASARHSQNYTAHDHRSALPRRFTTDSGRVPTLSSITTQRAPEPQDFAQTAAMHKVQLLEKKRMEYEKLREQKRRFEAEMQKLDLQQRLDEQELAAMQEDLGRIAGHQSEPTTPPEYRDAGFPNIFSRPNRYSTSSLVSPPGLYNRPSRSGSQLTSPQSGILQSAASTRFAFDDQLPSRSVPASRRNSDEDEKEEAVRQDPTSHRSTNALNRYSMPVTRSRTGLYDLGLDQTNTTRFLFGDEDNSAGDMNHHQYGQVPSTDESFPTLTRHDDYSLSALSTTMDLALEQAAGAESSAGWAQVNRHRQQSLSTISSTQLNGSSSAVSGQQSGSSDISGISTVPSSLRHSFDLKSADLSKFYPEGVAEANAMNGPTGHNHAVASPPKLQMSYSANDVPTVKNGPGGPVMSLPGMTVNNHANQHFHNHNASIGRIPAGAMANRHNRELSNDNNGGVAPPRQDASAGGAYVSIVSALHANAMPFGPMSGHQQQQMQPQQYQPLHPPLHQPQQLQQQVPQAQQPPQGMSAQQMALPGTLPGGAPQAMAMAAVGPYGNANGAGYYNAGAYANPGGHANGGGAIGYANGLPLLAQQLGNMSVGAPSSMYSSANYTGYGNIYGGSQPPSRDSQAQVIQKRRAMDNEAMTRFNNLPLESVGGTIYELCKDQHGCRYLQKQLENRMPDQIHMIWLETNQHVVELMTDPFGNYLCQKLLEYCNDEERTVLIQNASDKMVNIAMNQHGTRALQKMIEFISQPEQVQLIIEALRSRVVDLIQDLNGNHVIQKCLNKLSCVDAQFIFDAVGAAPVEVGTHRHGCCVLQRCIDHASGEQKVLLIQRISEHAVTLVQDPFGNYVVQYIIDLNEPSFTEPLVGMFRGRIGMLSRHKFSSNVIEKCLRCAQDPSRDMIAEELLSPGEMDRLLRDNFANYVIQTALDYSTHFMKHRLVDAIRPLLPNIRSTPYGRRIQAKIQAFDSRSGQTSGQVTPSDATQGQIPLTPAAHARAQPGNSNVSILATTGFPNGLNGLNGASGRGTQMFPPAAVLTVPPPSAPSTSRPAGPPQYAPPQFSRQQQPSAPGHVAAAVMPENGEQNWL